MKLAVIGAGNMGGAIATAVIQAELVLPKNLLLIEPDEEKRENLGNKLFPYMGGLMFCVCKKIVYAKKTSISKKIPIKNILTT